MIDALGFTDLELALFLGRYPCKELLPATINVQRPLEKQPHPISLIDFEKIFGLVYRPFPVFPSYQHLARTIKLCPYILRWEWLVTENYALARLYQQQLAKGYMTPSYVKWICPKMGYGLFADSDLASGEFIGEYTGVVRQLSRLHPDHNAYCLHYPTRFWSWHYLVIDALREGNLMRFMNHSSSPTVQPWCVVDRGLLRHIFVTSQPIPRHTQLTFDYGPDFWQKRMFKDSAANAA